VQRLYSVVNPDKLRGLQLSERTEP
jgi:hypothetical protein